SSGLLREGLKIFVVRRDVAADAVLGGNGARGTDGAGHVASGRAYGTRQLRAFDVQFAGPVAELVMVQLESGAAARVGPDEARARSEVALVDPADDLRVRVVPQPGAGAARQPGREERRAVAAVEDEALAGLDALDDLPAARARHQTAATTPSSSLARTTAR